MPFGENLRKLMEKKNISVTELAERTGINRSTLYSYLRRDTKKVDPEVVKKLIDILGDDAFCLYDWDDAISAMNANSPQNVSLEEHDLILKWRGLDDYGRKAVKAVLDVELERIQDDISREEQN